MLKSEEREKKRNKKRYGMVLDKSIKSNPVYANLNPWKKKRKKKRK